MNPHATPVVRSIVEVVPCIYIYIPVSKKRTISAGRTIVSSLTLFEASFALIEVKTWRQCGA